MSTLTSQANDEESKFKNTGAGKFTGDYRLRRYIRGRNNPAIFAYTGVSVGSLYSDILSLTLACCLEALNLKLSLVLTNILSGAQTPKISR